MAARAAEAVASAELPQFSVAAGAAEAAVELPEHPVVAEAAAAAGASTHQLSAELALFSSKSRFVSSL